MRASKVPNPTLQPPTSPWPCLTPPRPSGPRALREGEKEEAWVRLDTNLGWVGFGVLSKAHPLG